MEHMLTLPENSFPVGLGRMVDQFNNFVTFPHFMKNKTEYIQTAS